MTQKELRMGVLVTATAAALAIASFVVVPANADTAKKAAGGSVITYKLKASDLIGKDVKNMNGEDVGSIDDLVIGVNDQVAYAVVSVGGFLGIGDKLVAVPYNKFRMRGEDVLVLDATKESLKKEAAFTYREDRDTYKARTKERVESWEKRVGDWKEGAAKKGKDAKKETGEKLDQSWEAVKEQWEKLENATAETWEDAEAGMEKAWKDFKEAWADAAS